MCAVQVDKCSYTNVLNDRRSEFSNFMWVSRELKPQIAYKQMDKPTPASHKMAVLNSPIIKSLIDKVFVESRGNLTREEVVKNIIAILNEMGYDKNLKLIRWLGFVLAKICLRICSGVYINTNRILQMKTLMGDCPVMFVPSHRSYADFIMMSFVCFTMDIAIPAIAAGMDFSNMMGMGTVLRKTGAFFMRRSLNNDSIYWTTFEEYMNQLLTKGELPFEFFIEGTRSRSNKSLPPKYGLISIYLKSFFKSIIPDIIFVPISISYDRILEESLFAYELLGVPKPKESTSGFFKSLKILREKFGSIYFHFGEPISARDYFNGKIDRSVNGLKPIHEQDLTTEERKIIPSFTHDLIRQQQKNTVLTVFNLMAVILNCRLRNLSRMSLKELKIEIEWLQAVLQELGGYVYIDKIDKNIDETFIVHQNLVKLVDDKNVELIFNDVQLDQINAVKFKAHKISAATMSRAVPYVMLQIYSNAVLHYLVDVAFIGILLQYHQELAEDALFNHFNFLRNLFSLEFVTFGPKIKLEYEKAIKDAKKLKLIEVNQNNCYSLGSNNKLIVLLCNTFEPFLVTYFAVCKTLQIGENPRMEQSVLKQVQMTLEKGLNNQLQFIHPYCLNLDSISWCLKILTKNEALTEATKNNAKTYYINKQILNDILQRLELYVPAAQNDLVFNEFPLCNKL